MIADEKIPSDGFKMSLALRDMRLALAAADAMTAPMPVASQEFVRTDAIIRSDRLGWGAQRLPHGVWAHR
jgi:3-hydroxyisobutyrate dehydrogenase-like beta-hydroxyacid dehydrogenase